MLWVFTYIFNGFELKVCMSLLGHLQISIELICVIVHRQRNDDTANELQADLSPPLESDCVSVLKIRRTMTFTELFICFCKLYL